MKISHNEITGAYYEDKNTLFDYILYGVYALVAFLIIDWFFPEVVTEVLSEVVMLVK